MQEATATPARSTLPKEPDHPNPKSQIASILGKRPLNQSLKEGERPSSARSSKFIEGKEKKKKEPNPFPAWSRFSTCTGLASCTFKLEYAMKQIETFDFVQSLSETKNGRDARV